MSGLTEAIEAGAKGALSEAMGHSCHDKACQCDGGLTCDYCLPRIMRAGLLAAAPALLKAVVAELGQYEVSGCDHRGYMLDSLLAALARLGRKEEG